MNYRVSLRVLIVAAGLRIERRAPSNTLISSCTCTYCHPSETIKSNQLKYTTMYTYWHISMYSLEHRFAGSWVSTRQILSVATFFVETCHLLLQPLLFSLKRNKINNSSAKEVLLLPISTRSILMVLLSRICNSCSATVSHTQSAAIFSHSSSSHYTSRD